MGLRYNGMTTNGALALPSGPSHSHQDAGSRSGGPAQVKDLCHRLSRFAVKPTSNMPVNVTIDPQTGIAESSLCNIVHAEFNLKRPFGGQLLFRLRFLPKEEELDGPKYYHLQIVRSIDGNEPVTIPEGSEVQLLFPPKELGGLEERAKFRTGYTTNCSQRQEPWGLTTVLSFCEPIDDVLVMRMTSKPVTSVIIECKEGLLIYTGKHDEFQREWMDIAAEFLRRTSPQLTPDVRS